MSMPPYTDSLLRDAYDLVAKYGSVQKAADAAGIKRPTLSTHFTRALERFGLPDPRAKTVHFEGGTAFPPRQGKERTLDELLQHKRDEANRSLEYDEQTSVVKINIRADGPIGLMCVGDAHIDDPGCDFPSLERDLAIAADGKEYILSGNIGDVRNNWIGRLTRLYADSTVSARETIKLVEWLFIKSGVKWAWLIRGNHDVWSGHNDPLDFISRDAGIGVDMPHGVRLRFVHPNKVETRMHARHDFPGHSQFNSLHGLKRETLWGHRDHIICAGHRHVGGDAGDVNGDGTVFQMLRVAGYKKVDPYQHENNFPRKPIHPSALVIVDPDEPDTSRARVWCAPTVAEGADYLKFKRSRFNSRPRAKAKPKRAA